MAGSKGGDREQARPQVGAIRFEPDADTELGETAAWYEARSPGLGTRFLDEVEGLLRAVAHQPNAFPKLVTMRPDPEVRRALLRHFPFAVVYFVTGPEVRVVAVAHARREPRYWLHRLAQD